MKDHHLLGHRFWLTIIIMFMGLQIPVLAQQSTADKVTLSLHQADIQDLVRWASSVTKKTIIIHPSVKGSITVVAGEEMSREEAYQVFLSVLQVHGFMVVDTDQALKVIPIDIGKESDIAVGGSSLSPEEQPRVAPQIFFTVSLSCTVMALQECFFCSPAFAVT